MGICSCARFAARPNVSRDESGFPLFAAAFRTRKSLRLFPTVRRCFFAAVLFFFTPEPCYGRHWGCAFLPNYCISLHPMCCVAYFYLQALCDFASGSA